MQARIRSWAWRREVATMIIVSRVPVLGASPCHLQPEVSLVKSLGDLGPEGLLRALEPPYRLVLSPATARATAPPFHLNPNSCSACLAEGTDDLLLTTHCSLLHGLIDKDHNTITPFLLDTQPFS